MTTMSNPCPHNTQIERPDDPWHAWECADCGYVYGRTTALEGNDGAGVLQAITEELDAQTWTPDTLDRIATIPIKEYETRIGTVSVEALRLGGEALLDRVTARLGVASRHLDRIRTGQLSLVPAVESEIERSFKDAEELLHE